MLALVVVLFVSLGRDPGRPDFLDTISYAPVSRRRGPDGDIIGRGTVGTECIADLTGTWQLQ